ncbi:hypothetical protein PVAG01_03470 [Phlyctema vagabunda]|uniref:Secreted protein n=1 Tax=Phlyctema vagabunda TaxID=108571 RepID=A0ABR4PLH2_9HELO
MLCTTKTTIICYWLMLRAVALTLCLSVLASTLSRQLLEHAAPRRPRLAPQRIARLLRHPQTRSQQKLP